MMSLLMRSKGQLWPTIDGPIVHATPDGGLLVDAFTACNRLRARLTFGRGGGGSAANARGYSFEDTVQAVIDDAGFGPPQRSQLRALRGKPLVRSGKTITDVDAIMVLPGGRCILVQAKSYPYTESYGAGRYRDVRNMLTKVSAEAASWRRKVEELSVRPSEDDQNFTLPAGHSVEPLFVLPFAPYLPIETATEQFDQGLPYICSVDELAQFLSARP